MSLMGHPKVDWDEVEPQRPTRGAYQAEQICAAVESNMDELVRLIEEETALVRSGHLFAAGELQVPKAECARQFIAGMEAVKKIRPAIEKVAPDAIERLKRRHEEFKSVLQMNLAVLATAREVSDNLIEDLARGVGRGPAQRGYGSTGAMQQGAGGVRGIAVDRNL
ncbi:MAG: flagellar protein FlgN [Alphaproteobacteria bacterium]